VNPSAVVYYCTIPMYPLPLISTFAWRVER
jgi:hypothetical protein